MPDKNDILIYNTPNGNSNVEVYLFDEDIWMTQAALADLFQTSRNNITMHVQNIYKEGELMEEATSKPDLLVRNEGSRTVKRTIKVYNLIVNIIRSSYNRQERFIMVRARKRFHSCVCPAFERKWFGAACFSIVFAHNFSGLIARSWSTEAQGNIPAFLFLRHRKRRERGCLCRRRRGFWAGRFPFSPIGRHFRIP